MCHLNDSQLTQLIVSFKKDKARQNGGQWGEGRGEEGSYRIQDVHPRTGEHLYLVLRRYAMHPNVCTQRLQNIFSGQECFPLIVVFKRSESKPHNARFSFFEMSKTRQVYRDET